MTTASRSGAGLGYESLPGLLARQMGDEKHDAAATSTLDVLWTLYDRVLRIDAARPDDPARDRFLMSKGHGPMAYYAVLAARGFFPLEWLDTFGQFESPLGLHPDRTLVRGVEISSGSLGHGLPIALGLAIGLQALGVEGTPRVYCLTGDAELEEGSNHEAIAVAGRRAAWNLTAIVIDNRSASQGWPGGIEARFVQEDWTAAVTDGRDHDAIEAALRAASDGAPHVVVAQVEAKGG